MFLKSCRPLLLESNELVQPPSASDVQATVFPSPHCHKARTGSSCKEVSTCVPSGFIDVPT